MHHKIILLLLVLMLSLSQKADAFQMKTDADLKAALNNIAVIELYTSEACPSCPPADHILSQFAREANIIALSCHVTYWDRRGQASARSLPACTQQQKAFNQKHKIKNNYTPQAVINGRYEMIGSRKRDMIKALRADEGAVKPLNVTREGGHLLLNYQGLALPSNAVLQLITLGAPYTAMRRGQRIVDVNPVQSIRYFEGAKDILRLELSHLSADRRYVVMVRESVGGRILAATKI